MDRRFIFFKAEYLKFCSTDDKFVLTRNKVSRQNLIQEQSFKENLLQKQGKLYLKTRFRDKISSSNKTSRQIFLSSKVFKKNLIQKPAKSFPFYRFQVLSRIKVSRQNLMKKQGFKAKYYLATKLQGNIFFKNKDLRKNLIQKQIFKNLFLLQMCLP